MNDEIIATIVSYCENRISYENIVNEWMQRVDYDTIVRVVLDELGNILKGDQS